MRAATPQLWDKISFLALTVQGGSIFNDGRLKITMADDIDMAAKYHLVKKKYQELQNLRIKAVAADIEDLRRKVEEHRRVHELAVRELREQNRELSEMIQDAERIRAEMERVSESNSRILRQLQMKDPILNTFLKRPEFKLRVLGKGSYEISYLDGKDYVFRLSESAEQSGFLSYESVRYPPRLARQARMEFIDQKVTFGIAEVANFCETICRGIRNCRF